MVNVPVIQLKLEIILPIVDGFLILHFKSGLCCYLLLPVALQKDNYQKCCEGGEKRDEKTISKILPPTDDLVVLNRS